MAIIRFWVTRWNSYAEMKIKSICQDSGSLLEFKLNFVWFKHESALQVSVKDDLMLYMNYVKFYILSNTWIRGLAPMFLTPVFYNIKVS
uniref:Uncharacterized protein n=1 Tax=Strigamia maritima TaxID=126957 RepID=T1IWI5_STRMM